ncbi:MAG: PQQ-binding-like beta-propeller repeat protein [Gemmatimonadaceae bacterium]
MRPFLRAGVWASLALIEGCTTSIVPADDWHFTGGEPGNSRSSALDQINRGNVAQLRVAWTYRTGDVPANGRGEIQATPIVVDDILYTTTPALAVVALSADSGTLIWRFAPPARHERPPFGNVNRGVVYWASGDDKRIFFTAGKRLYALDARTGRLVPAFGDSGSVDLAKGLSRDIGDSYLVATSPGVIYKDLLIQGMRVDEGEGAAPGDLRAYDVRTGAIRWTFHTIPRPGEFGHDTWPANAWKTAGGANAWAGMAVDVERGIVFVPTGSATPDFYGGDRIGANLFANSLLALDAATGKRLWHFQAVHHDLWDRDLPAAPNLVTVTHNGRRVDAVAQITKQGFVFLFDRETGAPLHSIEERPVPPSDLSGEQAWPTQPHPTRPAPFARQSFTESDVADLSPSARDAAMKRFRSLRPYSLWQPPSREGSIVLPGFDGGGEWGGAAVDTESGILFVNASDVPWIAQMRETARLPSATDQPRSGAAVYSATCASCHGGDRRGIDRAPSLVGIAARLSDNQLRQIIERGQGFMPSFAGLPEAEKNTLINYLLGLGAPKIDMAVHARNIAELRTKPAKSPYEFAGYERWRDSSGYPAIRPPWGTLTAIDLNTGEHRWRIPLGEHPELTARGIAITGTEQYGGPIVTAGGLVFIAATQDAKFRALDSETGKVLWEATLPAPGFATPATYAVRDKQYVVIAAGGGKLGARSHDAYVAFALP